MKRIVMQIVMVLVCHCLAIAQTYKADTIRFAGEKSIKLVILGDGYTVSEMTRFEAEAVELADSLFSHTPWKEYENYFSVFMVKTPSNVTGAGLTPNAPIDNFYGTTFGYAGVDRMPWPSNYSKVYEVLRAAVPDYDHPIMLVNFNKYGGAGGSMICMSNYKSGYWQSDYFQTLVHEIGHCVGGLADEYWYNGYERPNQTQESDPSKVKWRSWVGDEEIGVYPYEDNEESMKWFRPHQGCIMRMLGRPYCAVCRQALIKKIHSEVDAITNYSPKIDDKSSVLLSLDQVYNDGLDKYVEGLMPFGITDDRATFSITVNHPVSTSLKTTWILDGKVQDSNAETFELDMSAISAEDEHTIVAQVENVTDYYRADNDKSDHRLICNSLVWKFVKGAVGDIMVDGINYSYRLGLQKATVIAGDYSAMENVVIPATITVDGTVCAVKSIDKDAFFNYYNIKSLTLSEGLESIGQRAFYYSGITSLTIPEGVKTIGDDAFSYCSNLQKLELPSTLISIGENFRNLRSLTTIITTASEPPTSSEMAFIQSNWVIDEGTDSWKETFSYPEGTLYVPVGCQTKYESAAGWKNFQHIYEGDLKETTVDGLNYSYVTGSKVAKLLKGDYSELESVVIPATITVDDMTYEVKGIDDDVFSYCYKLKLLTLSEGLETIGKNAFNATSVQRLELPASLTSIGSSAFSNMRSLASIIIHATEPPTTSEESFTYSNWYQEMDGTYKRIINSISAALYVPIGCKSRYASATGWGNLQQIYEGELMETTVDGLCYSYTTASKVAMVIQGDYNDLDQVTIPSSVTIDGTSYTVKAIGYNAFANSALTSLTISKGIEWIGDYAFEYCPITTLIIPEGVKGIGRGSFYFCWKLQKVDLPSSLISIGEDAFCNTSGLTDVISRGAEPLEIDKGIFSTYNSSYNEETGSWDETWRYPTNLYVLVTSIAKYTDAYGWNYFANIQGLPSVPIKIGSANQVPYYCDKNLDFASLPDLKAYVATGYDKTIGTIWLTRVTRVPANTGFLLMGEAGDYSIPIIEGISDCYYKNMFKGTIEGMTIQMTDGDYTNYYLSNGDYGIGFYKVTKEEGVALGANRAYLPIPTVIPANGSEGDTEVIKVGAALQVPYFTSKSLDFTSLEDLGVKAYTAIGYNYGTGTIWLSRVKLVPARTGVLVMAAAGGEYNVPTASVASIYENMFVGSETAQTIFTTEAIDGIDYVNYYLSNGDYGVGFYKITKADGVSMQANRCYLQVPYRASSGARGKARGVTPIWSDIILSDDGADVICIPIYGSTNGDNDGTTNVESSMFNVQSSDVYYNLQGQRVDKPGKGIYIRNGKKVLIK